jgi:hypothetical protein
MPRLDQLIEPVTSTSNEVFDGQNTTPGMGARTHGFWCVRQNLWFW